VDWAGLLKLIHIALAMALVTGIVGRWLLLAAAERTDRLERTEAILAAADPFEITVRVSSILVLVAGLLTAWAQGYPWLGLTTGWMLASLILSLGIAVLVPTVFLPRGRRFALTLEGARATGLVTPELRAAFADPAVRSAHVAELVALAAIVALMVLKPF
jgi:Predicted integral membrane protein (DUF2269)